MKKICAFLIILLSATLLCSCGSKKTSNFDVNIEEIDVDLNAASEFKILYLSDLHISVLNDEVASADEATVSQRILDYTYEGNTSVDTWKQWITYINDQSPDLVLFGADMLDFCSIENIQILEEGLSSCKSLMSTFAPTMIVNHSIWRIQISTAHIKDKVSWMSLELQI